MPAIARGMGTNWARHSSMFDSTGCQRPILGVYGHVLTEEASARAATVSSSGKPTKPDRSPTRNGAVMLSVTDVIEATLAPDCLELHVLCFVYPSRRRGPVRGGRPGWEYYLDRLVAADTMSGNPMPDFDDDRLSLAPHT